MPYRGLLWLPYALLLPLGIHTCNRRQEQVRDDQQRELAPLVADAEAF